MSDTFVKDLGKVHVSENLKEIIDPEKTALLIVDMQNDFASERGFLRNSGSDIFMIRACVPRVRVLLDNARKLGLFILFTQNTLYQNKKGEILDSPAHILSVYGDARDRSSGGFATLDKTWGQEILKELQPTQNEIILKKIRPSAFFGTPMDLLLREQEIESIIVTGCVTQGCILSTARDALSYDYDVVVPEDCVSSQNKQLHRYSLAIMKERCTITRSESIMKIWQNL